MKTKKSSIVKKIAACALVCATAGVFSVTVAANGGDKVAEDNAGNSAVGGEPSVWSDISISPVKFDAPSELDESAPRDEYKALGLTERESDKALMFEGKLVRWFIDEAQTDDNGGYAVQQVYYNEKGKIDLHTVRERKYNADGSYDPFGKLKAIEEMKDFDPGCILMAEAVTACEISVGEDNEWNYVFTAASDGEEIDIQAGDVIEATMAEGTDISAGGKTLADIFAGYKDYGITYDEEKGDIYLNGELVGKLVDIREDGIFSFMSRRAMQGDKGIKVRTVYKDGKLTDIRQMTADEENAQLSEW